MCGAAGGGRPLCAAGSRGTPYRGARGQPGVHVASGTGCAVADPRGLDRQCRGTRPATVARRPREQAALFAGDPAARKPDIRSAQCQGAPDRQDQHHRAGVGARQPERGGAAAGGACRGKSRRGDPRLAQGAQPGFQPLFPRAAARGRLCGPAQGAGDGAGRRGLCEPLFRQLRDDPRTGRGLCRGADRGRGGRDLRPLQYVAGFQPRAGRFARRGVELYRRQQGVCLWLSDGQAGAGCHPGA